MQGHKLIINFACNMHACLFIHTSASAVVSSVTECAEDVVACANFLHESRSSFSFVC